MAGAFCFMRIIKLAFLLLIAVCLLQSCKGKYYNIPSGAMAETLPVGSRIYVVKSTVFKNDDIAVFNYFGDDYRKPLEDEFGKYEQSWQKIVQRIIASSGDKMEIRNGDVYLNDELIRFPAEGLQEYTIKSTTPIEDFPETESRYHNNMESTGSTITYRAQLTLKEAAEYRNRKPTVLSVEKNINTDFNAQIAQYCDTCNYSIDNYGPVKIPSPGDTIEVNAFNIRFYQQIPGIEKGTFVVKEKLYFMMGDNRHGSMDSRYIGVISHSNMVGIVK